MPFKEQKPRVFTKSDVKRLRSNQNGVYGILSNGNWIYIGKAEDIRKRLLDHLSGDNPCILRENPTHYVGEVFSGDASEREKELILELDPLCNKKADSLQTE